MAPTAFANHEGTPTSVSVVAAQSSVTIPSSIKLTVSADRHLYGTGYSVAVVDEDKGVTMGPCGNPCDLYAGTFWADNANPQPRHFHGELRGPGGVVVATSGQVTVDVRKHTWNVVSVVPNPASRFVPGSVWFEATLDETTYGTPYSIYMSDLDSTSPPTTCNQAACGKYIWRQWADNVNPKPGRVRVEVRNAAGDIASNTVDAEAQFRRYIFSPSLSFSTQAGTNGAVIHKATVTLAPSDPGLYGTPYWIKIKKADGTTVCSAPQAGCTATLGVGESYRGVVEDSQGRNFGDSGSWTLTGSGPESAVVDGVDLALLAKQVSADDICATALVSGGPSTNNNSVPDTYEACEAKRLAGASPLEILRDIAVIGGGLLVLHMLEADEMTPQFPPGTVPEEWETMIAAPPPAAQQFREDELADRLQALNADLSAPAANDVARQCLYLLGKRGLNGRAECLGYPIFVSGSDVPAATKHDLGAIKSWPLWTLLNYDGRGKAKPGKGWYTSVDPCDKPYDGQLFNCHEYPYFSTLQGGPEPAGGRRPIVDVIDAEDNQAQGRHLQNRFYRKCGIDGRVDNPAFLSLPVSPVGPIPTLGICNGSG
jgi:hypothetical protein